LLLVQHFLVLADFAWYCVSGALHGALVGFDGGRAWWLASARFFFAFPFHGAEDGREIFSEIRWCALATFR